jgi:hypothetical protein
LCAIIKILIPADCANADEYGGVSPP